MKNTSLPQKASKSTADVVETSQESSQQGSKQEFALIPIIGSLILARTYETMKKFLEFGMASSQERERERWMNSILVFLF